MGMWFYVILIAIILALAWRTKGPEEGFRDMPYEVLRVPNVLTKGECKALMDYAKPKLVRSKVSTDDPAQAVSSVRTSTQTWASRDDPQVGHIVRKMMRTMARITGVFEEDLYEDLQLARYTRSQEYKPHYDACVDDKRCSSKNKIYRRATFLVYLTDGFQGGETDFPEIADKVTPKRGHGVLFYDTHAHTGLEIPSSLHAGMPVKRGVKWIANLWLKYPRKE